MMHLYEITRPRSLLVLINFDVMCAGVLNTRFLVEKAIGFHWQAGLLELNTISRNNFFEMANLGRQVCQCLAFYETRIWIDQIPKF